MPAIRAQDACAPVFALTTVRGSATLSPNIVAMSVRETVERLLNQLPERRTPELLIDRLLQTRSSLERTFQRDGALLSDVLTLAAWSPLLATTLENNPDYVTWLQRERKITRVRTREELGESLGRFALINSQLNPHVML